MKKYFLFTLITLFSFLNANSQAYLISTLAGTGSPGYSGDGGQATAAELNQPWGVAVDKAGNVYAAEYNNQTIRKINTNGIITTIAGNTKNGFAGDGGAATLAELNYPTGVAVDTLGNVYIADQHNNRVRKVNTSGIISTYAGNGIASFSGDGGAATAAEMNVAAGVAVDVSGNIFIADFYNFRVRKVNTSGKISTVAGNGNYSFSGDGGQATAASIKSFIGVAVDKNGNIYIADQANGRVRKVNTSGIMSTFAGNGTQSYSGDGGLASAAELSYPYGVGTDVSGNVFIADYANERVRYIPKSDIISTVAGDGTLGYFGDGGPATAAELSTLSGVAVDAIGNVYIADQTNNCIRKLTPIPSGLQQLTNNSEAISVYPNPGNGVFTMLFNQNENISDTQKIEIYSILGTKIFDGFLNPVGHSTEINLTTQPNGIYFYKVLGSTGKITTEGKLIIQK